MDTHVVAATQDPPEEPDPSACRSPIAGLIRPIDAQAPARDGAHLLDPGLRLAVAAVDTHRPRRQYRSCVTLPAPGFAARRRCTGNCHFGGRRPARLRSRILRSRRRALALGKT